MFKVDINKIRGEFIDRVSDTIIYDVSTKFSKINSVVGLEDNIETVISKYLSGLLEKRDFCEGRLDVSRAGGPNKSVMEIDTESKRLIGIIAKAMKGRKFMLL